MKLKLWDFLRVYNDSIGPIRVIALMLGVLAYPCGVYYIYSVMYSFRVTIMIIFLLLSCTNFWYSGFFFSSTPWFFHLRHGFPREPVYSYFTPIFTRKWILSMVMKSRKPRKNAAIQSISIKKKLHSTLTSILNRKYNSNSRYPFKCNTLWKKKDYIFVLVLGWNYLI